MHYDSPIGLAAGFDKNGECVAGALGLGFGFVEVSSAVASLNHYLLAFAPKH
jgi:dihydroorotate dehydrogenase